MADGEGKGGNDTQIFVFHHGLEDAMSALGAGMHCGADVSRYQN